MSAIESDLKDLDVSRETLDRLERYHALLLKWQKAKNLVAPSTVGDAAHRHFLDSAQLIPLFNEMSLKGPIVDIGSGAGFPGLVLACADIGPVHLVESNGKKASFLNTVIRETGAKAHVHYERIEKLAPFPANVITARACATVRQLLDWAAPFITADTKAVLLKGAKWQEELTEAQETWKMDFATRDSLTDPSGRVLVLSDISARAA